MCHPSRGISQSTYVTGIDLWKVVGATGFEPATPCAQGRCATRLRYAPTIETTRLYRLFLFMSFNAQMAASGYLRSDWVVPGSSSSTRPS